MKKIILFAFLSICTITSYSQEYYELEDFKIRFGISREKTLELLASDEGLKEQVDTNKNDENLTEQGIIVLDYITYYGFMFDKCYLEYNSDRLVCFTYTKKVESGYDAGIGLLALENIFNKEYGKARHPGGNENIMRWDNSINNSVLTTYGKSNKEGMLVILINEKE